MDERPLIDTILVASIGGFFFFLGGILRRETIVGWSLATLCFWLGLIFGYSFIRPYYPHIDDLAYVIETAFGPLLISVGTVLRTGVLVTLVIATIFLCWERWFRR